jgi:repressor LexA
MATLTSRQKQVYGFILDHLTRHGYPPTLQEIAAHLKVSGNLGVLRHLRALEQKGLIERTTGSSRGIRLPEQRTGRPVALPLVGAVRAGLPQLAVEEAAEHFSVDAALVKSPDSFLLKVQGDSMIEAHILPGDLAVVRPQPSAKNGEIVVALIDGEAILKRFYLEGEEIRLKAEHPTMRPLIYRADSSEARILGKVTGICRPLE